MRRLSPLLTLVAGAALVSTWACSPTADDDGSSQAQLKGAGTSGATYPEAVLIDAQNKGDTKDTWKCSGAVIAPKVVLTSGICAASHTSWSVTAPQAGKQTVSSTTAAAYKWSKNAKGHTDVKAHNIGLIFLDKAIVLESYPVLSHKAVTASQKVIAIGRTRDKKVSSSELFTSEQLTLRPSSGGLFPFDYSAAHIVEAGDSGGPQEVVGSMPHLIVSVTSKIVGDKDTFSRVDQLDVADWIQQQVELHGGFAAASKDAGADSAETPEASPIDAGKGASEAGPEASSAQSDASADAVVLEAFAGPCTTDDDCNMGQFFTNLVCKSADDAQKSCTKGCRTDLDCPRAELCDTTLEHADCR